MYYWFNDINMVPGALFMYSTNMYKVYLYNPDLNIASKRQWISQSDTKKHTLHIQKIMTEVLQGGSESDIA